MKLKKKDLALKTAQELVAMLPHEILPHMLYIDAKYNDATPPLYAKEVAKYLKKQQFNYEDLLHGPYITRITFIQEHLITGRLFHLVKFLQDKFNTTTDKNTIDLQLSLALALFFNKNFEESYVIYNALIDTFKIRDARTLFLAAGAAIEAKHHENAIALLELSKFKDRLFPETRYALGLLYLEANNPRGAAIEFSNMATKSFHTNYFNFDIDLDKLTFQYLHPNAK
jgi:tetratricopeptide (TPR) repeat protein